MDEETFFILDCNNGPYPVFIRPDELDIFLDWVTKNIGVVPVKDETYKFLWVRQLGHPKYNPPTDLFDGWIVNGIL